MALLDYLFELALSELLRFSQLGKTKRGICVKQGLTEAVNQHRNDEVNRRVGERWRENEIERQKRQIYQY